MTLITKKSPTMTSQLGMKPSFAVPFAVYMVLFLTMMPLIAYGADRCPKEPRCECNWSSGKRKADCSNAGFTTIPTSDQIDDEVQILILNGNNFGRLEKDAFKSAGLLNLQELELKNCHILEIHEHAFRDLKILMKVDLSSNNLTKLQPKTFDGNENLQTIKASQNPLRELMPYQFPPLRNLRTLDFSHCELQKIDRKAFHNLGASVETIWLNNNQLKTVMQDTLSSLSSLKILQLHGNHWICDCKLKSFRDYVVEKKLYQRPTSCQEPPRLYNKMWDDIQTRDFACKPHIRVIPEYVFSSPGRNATLSCLVEGSPLPDMKWVNNGRIINNNTTPVAFSQQKWVIYESQWNYQKWYNLTITKANYDNLGEYRCVAENNGGMHEQKVTLTFDDPADFKGLQNLTPDQLTIIVGAVTASLVFIAIMVALICGCCFCKKAKKAKTSEANKAKTAISAYGEQDQSHQRLLPPVNNAQCEMNSPAGNYHHQYGDVTELTELRTPSVLSKPHSTTNSSHSRNSIADNSYDPDLINHHRKTSTPLSVQTLMASRPSPHGQPLMNGGHHRVSPFTRSGTLPMNHHYHPHHPRSVSCDHTSQTLRLTPQPHQKPKQSLQHPPNAHQRPGYVTLPRRPRSSWSVPPRDTPSPMYTTMKRAREPIYDGVGPRTSADGSSMGTLPRSSTASGGILVVGHHGAQIPVSNVSAVPHQKYSLGPYYAPIAEIQECPGTPTKKRGGSEVEATPPPHADASKASSVANSSSEMTLMEESISSYCEPFGKALIPPPVISSGAESTPTPSSGKSRHSTTSAESELEALIIPNGKHSPKEHKLEEDIPPMMPLLPPILTPQNGGSHHMSESITAFNNNGLDSHDPMNCNGNNNKKVPPKTLPKPKVRPLPPPKPSKSSMLKKPVVFQDEGADGSEV